MLRNYFRSGLRSIWSSKLHSSINVFGLALGIAVVLLIGGYVAGELAVNKSLKDVERTYVIHSEWSPQNIGVYYTTLGPLASTLKEQFPLLIKDCYRYTIAGTIMSSANGKVFKEQLQIGDSSFIDMFGFKLAHGNPRSPFGNDGIVLSESIARKYYGRTNVLGETLILQTNGGKEATFQISGVLKDMPSNSVVNFAGNPSANEIFLPMSSLKYFMQGADQDWGFKYMVSLIKLGKGVTPADLQKPLGQIVASNAPPEYKNSLKCELKPLADYYLLWGNERVLKMIRTLSALAIFILLLVVANFVIIMISSSTRRLREIGLRKLFGGVRRQLIIQFLVESILISVIAMIASFVLYTLLRPAFQDLLDRPLRTIQEIQASIFFWILIFTLLTGSLAGIYPAFRLSGFKIVQAVKGKLPAFGEGKVTRKALLCFQTTIASFVLICAVIIAQQLKFIRDYDLGYTKQNVLVITSVPRQWDEKGISKLDAVRSDLLRDSGVMSASISYEVPDGNAGNRYNFRTAQGRQVDMPLLEVDEYFAQTFSLDVIAGNFFHHKEGSYRSHRVVLNEEAVRSFGWTPASAIGREIIYDQNEKPLTVVGVVRNFHFNSLFESIAPLSLVHIRDGSSYRYLSLSLSNVDRNSTLARLTKNWAEVFPSAPFDYIFMEDKLSQFYAREDQLYKSSKLASLLTIVVTLSGMIAFMSVSLVRRVQEIGIRRVHGATSVDLIMLLIKDFLWQFIIAGAFAFVLAYYFLTTWLSNFQYRIEIPFYSFLLVHLAILITMGLLIAGYSLRTVRMNPLNVLRYE